MTKAPAPLRGAGAFCLLIKRQGKQWLRTNWQDDKAEDDIRKRIEPLGFAWTGTFGWGKPAPRRFEGPAIQFDLSINLLFASFAPLRFKQFKLDILDALAA
jgi:hypothetical protein